MRVFRNFDDVAQIRRSVVTIGSYDGVHCGHRRILSQICDMAQERDAESVVVTFAPHPRHVLHPQTPLLLLNTLEEKLILLESVGVENVIVVDFTPEFSRLSSAEFVKGMLVDHLHVDTLLVGYNHHLGHAKESDADALARLAEHYGFRLIRMEKQKVGGEKVSSTIIRSVVAQGDMALAARYLGAPYLIRATVSPNGELLIEENCKLLPPAGRYPVEVECAQSRRSNELVIENGMLPRLFCKETLCAVDTASVEPLLVRFA